MELIDQQYTRTPFYGSPKLTVWLKRQGYEVNHKRVERLMRKMGLQAIYPKPFTSRRDSAHKVYPYLLSGVEVVYPNQVWSADITYIRVKGGFLYLVAILVRLWRNRLVQSICAVLAPSRRGFETPSRRGRIRWRVVFAWKRWRRR